MVNGLSHENPHFPAVTYVRENIFLVIFDQIATAIDHYDRSGGSSRSSVVW